MKKLLHKRGGFTLIELLIVIVIIGILAVGFAPSLLSAPKKARDAVRKGQMASIKGAIEAYALDNSSGYPKSSTNLTCLTTSKGLSADGALIAANFQGGTLPKDPSYTGDTTDTCGVSYKLLDKCYILSTKLEVAKSGNSTADKDTPVCTTALKDNSGDYYQVIVNY